MNDFNVALLQQVEPYHLRQSAITNPAGQTTRYHYSDDHSQQPHQIEDPHGGIRRLTYDRADQLTGYTDCTGARTLWRHDRWGQIIEVKDAQGRSEHWSHDRQGRPLSHTNAAGETTAAQRNAAGDIISITGADGNTTHFELDPWGQASAARQGNEPLWQIERDSAMRPITLTDASGSKTRFVWNELDQLTEQTDWTGTTERYQRDQAGQIIQTQILRSEQLLITTTGAMTRAASQPTSMTPRTGRSRDIWKNGPEFSGPFLL